MFFFKFIDDEFHGLLGSNLESLAGRLQLLGERFEDRRGRAGLAYTVLGDIDAVGTPYLDLFVEGSDDAADSHVAGMDSTGESGDHTGGLHLENLVAVLHLLADGEGLGASSYWRSSM